MKVVKRITTTLDDDSSTNVITETNGKAHIEEVVLDDTTMQKDVDTWVDEFSDVICQKPGLTDRVELAIDTGVAAPVSQRPYQTPVTLRDAVSKEVDCLIESGYIRPSDSDRASLIVTAKKPDGSLRLCIDYKRLNEVTVPAPFYMPKSWRLRVRLRLLAKLT